MLRLYKCIPEINGVFADEFFDTEKYAEGWDVESYYHKQWVYFPMLLKKSAIELWQEIDDPYPGTEKGLLTGLINACISNEHQLSKFIEQFERIKNTNPLDEIINMFPLCWKNPEKFEAIIDHSTIDKSLLKYLLIESVKIGIPKMLPIDGELEEAQVQFIANKLSAGCGCKAGIARKIVDLWIDSFCVKIIETNYKSNIKQSMSADEPDSTSNSGIIGNKKKYTLDDSSPNEIELQDLMHAGILEIGTIRVFQSEGLMTLGDFVSRSRDEVLKMSKGVKHKQLIVLVNVLEKYGIWDSNN